MAEAISGTVGTAAVDKDYIDAAYIDKDNKAKEVSG